MTPPNVKHATALLISALAIPLAYFTVAFEQWAGATRNPFFVAAVLFMSALIGLTAWLASGKRRYFLVPAAIATLLLFLSVVDTTPVKPALRAISQIHPGMKESDIRAILNRQFPDHGRFRRPDFGPIRDGVLSFALDPNDGRYNAAIVTISFENGRCTTARFLAD